LSDLDWRDAASAALAEPFDVARRHLRGIPLPQQTSWLQPSPLTSTSAAITLPVPAQNVFEIEENPRATAQSLLPFSHHAEQRVATVRQRGGNGRLIATNAGDSRPSIRAIRGKPHLGGARKPDASKVAGRATHKAVGARRGTLKHLVQVKKRNV
jgi:hypothetical protein